MHKVMLAFVLYLSVFGFAQCSRDAAAAVTRLEIVSKTPYGSFKSGEYTRWDALIVGELSPTAEAIPDLEKASRNAHGMVEYSTRLTRRAQTVPC